MESESVEVGVTKERKATQSLKMTESAMANKGVKQVGINFRAKK